jgi:putative transposase
MAKLQSWEVSDALWEKVAPLIPLKKRNPGQKYIRKSG